MGDFPQRMAMIESQVGDGDLVMGGRVGQAYAGAEHNRKYYKHPRGGMAEFLTVPFMAEHEDMLIDLANSVITESGSNLRPAAIRVSKRFDDIVQKNAPVQSNLLRNSTEYFVEDQGRTIFSVNQHAPRNWDKQ